MGTVLEENTNDKDKDDSVEEHEGQDGTQKQTKKHLIKQLHGQEKYDQDKHNSSIIASSNRN